MNTISRSEFKKMKDQFLTTRRSKYRSRICEFDGMKFASKREMLRYVALKRLQDAGIIKDLKRQVIYPLCVNGIEITSYRGDFTYLDENQELVCEDSKGFVTDIFSIKKKWMKIQYGIEIKLV